MSAHTIKASHPTNRAYHLPRSVPPTKARLRPRRSFGERAISVFPTGIPK
jgi:hypothetical protein